MPVAIITGAAGGIGRAIALKLTGLGYAVVLAGRTLGTLETLADEVKRAGGHPLVVPTDVAKSEQVDQLIAATLQNLGRIDVLVNTVGYAPMIPTPDVTPAQWREILDTNLSAAFHTTRAVWPIMQRQHLEYMSDHRQQFGEQPVERNAITGGVIINFSSAAARDPFPGLGAYAVAKAGINMLTHVTAREGEPNGIRVHGIAPSAVETPMFRSLLLPEQVPTEEILLPEDIAAVVADMVAGSLRYSAGETLYIHRRI